MYRTASGKDRAIHSKVLSPKEKRNGATLCPVIISHHPIILIPNEMPALAAWHPGAATTRAPDNIVLVSGQ
jgi:hypothetical protein